MPDTYEMPRHGWTCFHCGETFRTPGSARQHFGSDPLKDPACRIKVGEERGLVAEIRRLEAKLGAYRSETHEDQTRWHAQAADHRRALVQAEQKGYDKGLRDRYVDLYRLSHAARALVKDSTDTNKTIVRNLLCDIGHLVPPEQCNALQAEKTI